jgi:predicted ATPase/Tfp pilus assembly protein PilF
LLLLDNWIDEPAASATVTALRSEALRVSFLITAREPTRLPGERMLALSGLSLGAGSDEARGEAAQLFVALVERADPAWQPDEHREAIGRICRQVHGLPLGVALAAAWTPFLGCEAVAEALERGPELLAAWPAGEGEPASRPALAAVASFWELLGPEEQRAVRGLSPFRGGFTREGAGQVAGASLFLLGALVDRAFLGREPAGRYQMHELLRAYAAHELAAHPIEEQAVRTYHLTYVLSLAEQVHVAWGGPDWAALAARLEADHDNARAALSWALVSEHGAEATQLAGALWRFWAQRGHAREGSGWLERVLATRAPTPWRARALHGAGVLAYYRAEYATATLYLEEACCLQRDTGDDAGVADACVALGVVAMVQGDYARAAARQEEGLAIYRVRGDDRGTGVALNNLGVIAHEQGNLELAEQCYSESLASARRRRAPADVAFSLNNLGSIADLRGDYARAITLRAESLDLYQELGDRWGAAVTRMNLGLEWFESGQNERARDLLREALKALVALGDVRNAARAMTFLARATWAAGDAERALTLFAAAETLFTSLGAPPPPDEAEPARRDREAARAALGSAGDLAVARGRALPLEEVVGIALATPQLQTASR